MKFQHVEYVCMYTVYGIKKNMYNRSTIVTTAQKYHSRQNSVEFRFAEKASTAFGLLDCLELLILMTFL